MTARHSLDQIVRGLDGVTAGPERIWLQSYEDSTAVGEDRLWCEDKVWPNDPEDHEPTEYVRADLFRDLEERLAKAAEALEGGDKGDGWQTIETAPKDETDILLADCRVHGGFMTVASYEIVDGSEWVWHTNDGPSYHTEAFTHWRPLPAAPSASIEGETP